MEDIMVNYAIPGAMILVAIAAGLAILFGILQMFISPKGAIKTIITVAILAAIIFGIYTISPSEKLGIFQTTKYDEITPFIMKFTQTSILSAIALILIGFASWFLLEIVNLFK